MSISKKSSDEIFDILIKDALIEKWNKELDELNLQTTPHEFSKNFNKHIQKIQFSIVAKNNLKSAGKFAIKAVASIAVIMGICFGGLLTQPEVNAAVQTVIKNVFAEFDSYQFVDNEINADNFDSSKQLGYIPEGYLLSSGNYAPGFVSLTYIDTLNNELIFEYFIADGAKHIVDNKHTYYKEFTKNKISYSYYESTDKDFPSALIWYNGGYAYGIYAHLNIEEFVEIAENID